MIKLLPVVATTGLAWTYFYFYFGKGMLSCASHFVSFYMILADSNAKGCFGSKTFTL